MFTEEAQGWVRRELVLLKSYLVSRGIASDRQLDLLVEYCSAKYSDLRRGIDRRTMLLSLVLGGPIATYLSGWFITPFTEEIMRESFASWELVAASLEFLVVFAIVFACCAYVTTCVVEEVIPSKEKEMHQFLKAIYRARCNGLSFSPRDSRRFRRGARKVAFAHEARARLME